MGKDYPTTFSQASESPPPAFLRYLDLEIAPRCPLRTPGGGFRTRLPERPNLYPRYRASRCTRDTKTLKTAWATVFLAPTIRTAVVESDGNTLLELNQPPKETAW